MARATRSTTAQHPAPLKKRKRSTSPHHPDTPKFQKTEDEPDDKHPAYLSSLDAQKILDVLELSDTQGLLDRVFPLHHAPDRLLSLRTLLEHPSEHPLTAVKSAINHLFPISSLPRSRPSPAASQQLAFSNLALSLLEQASCTSIQVSLERTEAIDPSLSDSPHASPILARRKYALVQHLPSGDYWSSLSTNNPASDLKALSTGHAELVAIIPSAASTSLDSVPTLGSVSSRPLAPTKPVPGQRRVTTGAFLDYGPYASFAPCFDDPGSIVGQRQLSEYIYHKEQKKYEEQQRRLAQRQLQSPGHIEELPAERPPEDVAMNVEPTAVSDDDLNNLLSPEDAKSFKEALGDLELEKAVQNLLDKNALALKRLQELQTRRLSGPDAKPVEEGSEEWETAQHIMDSLATLASLRPRCAGDDESPLVPSPAVLRKLHRSLALEPSPGWYGNLPASRATALHDDSTIKAKSPTVAPAIPVSTPVPNTAVPSSQAPAATGYSGYNYNYAATTQQPQQQPYRSTAATYASYKPGQASYYQSYVPATTQQSYYNQSYASTSGQQPYGSGGGQTYQYGSWYNQYQPATQAATKPGTPTSTAATPTTYSSFFASGTTANGAATPRPTAVANTVANKVAVPQGAGTWPASTYPSTGVAPTLPSHLRTSQPSTPAPAYQQPAAYYQTYQMQAAASATPSR